MNATDMKHLTRPVKYFVSSCLQTAATAAALHATGTAAGPTADLWRLLLFTPRGWFLIGALVLLSAVYPRAGYTTVGIEGDAERHRQQIDAAFRSMGFLPAGEKDGVRFFRAESFVRRLRLRFDDRIRLSQNGRRIELEGPRKVVARMEYTLKSAILQDNE